MTLSNPRRWALFTGAGFSANWGFPVAQEVWSLILSDSKVQSLPDLRNALLGGNGFNYEDVLAKAQRGELSADSKAALWHCITKIFDELQTRLNNDDIGVTNAEMGVFLQKFVSQSINETGLIFSLNQDMLIEATTGAGHTENGIIRPGLHKPFSQGAVLRANYGLANSRLGAEPNVRFRVNHSNDPPFALAPGNSYYIKLHGSWDMESEDRELAMVMGGDKDETISRSRLLTDYLKIFEAFCRFGDRRILMIGYGFGDHHINLKLIDGILNYGLRIFVWDKRSPQTVFDALRGAGYEDIWSGLCGFTQRDLSRLIAFEDIFERRDSREFFKSIFEEDQATKSS